MKRKRASEIFRDVDPGLHVIDGGQRRKSRKATGEDWQRAGGAVCPNCGQEAVRFRPRDGACITCGRNLDEKQDRDEKREAKLQRQIKAHNARIDKRKRAA